MVSKKILYAVFALVGMTVASGTAWWYQSKRQSTSSGAEEARPVAPARPEGAQARAGPVDPARPVTVEVAQVELASLSDDAQSVGSLRSRQGVMIRPEISGRITQLNFRDGQRVKRGQLLVQFDDQLPQAQVKQSEAELSIARANHQRNQELLAQNFISQRTLDESAANLQVAQAKLALAQASLARLRILAPFDGIVGIRSVNVGDYLKDGADIVNLEDIDTVFVDYRLPERFQNKVRPGQIAQLELDALPGQKFEARVQAVDPLIDANGRSVGVRASINNRQLQLRPGMFARVTTVFGVRERAKVIPEEAIVPQGGRQFVVKLMPGAEKDSFVSQRVEVKLGIRRPGGVEILEGLKAGDTVVTAGHQRLARDGSPVKVLEVGRSNAR